MKKKNIYQSTQICDKVNSNLKGSKSKFKLMRIVGRRVGSILGTNNFIHSVSVVQQTLVNSVPRTRALWIRFTDKQEEMTVLTDIQSDTDRFWASMEYHKIDSAMLETMVTTTKRNFDLYVVILICSVSLGIISLISFPTVNPLNGLIRFVVVPFLGALIFKHAFANWIFRNRTLSTPSKYLRANDKWPRIKSKFI